MKATVIGAHDSDIQNDRVPIQSEMIKYKNDTLQSKLDKFILNYIVLIIGPCQ